MTQFADAKYESQRGRQRVTIQFEQGAPTLHLRFSSLNLPGAALIAPNEKHPQSEWEPEIAPSRHDSKSSSLYAPSSIGPAEIVTIPQRSLSQRLVRAQLFRAPITSDARIESYRSSRSDTMEAVQAMAGKFPDLPQSARLQVHTPRTAKGSTSPLWDEKSRPPSTVSDFAHRSLISEKKKGKQALHIMNDTEKVKVWKQGAHRSLTNSPASVRSRKLSHHGTKVGPMPIDPFSDDDDNDDTVSLQPHSPIPFVSPVNDAQAKKNRRLARHFSVPVSPTSEELREILTLHGPGMDVSAAEVNPFANLGMNFHSVTLHEQGSPSPRSPRITEWAGSSQGAQSTPTGKRMRELPPFEMVERRHLPERRGDIVSPAISTLHKSGGQNKSMEELAIPWLKNPEMEAEERRLAHLLAKKTHLSRIKSVGTAPQHATPLPVRTHHLKGSFHLQSIKIPPNDAGMVEIVQGSLESAYSGRSVLRDSQVLQIEEGGYEQRQV